MTEKIKLVRQGYIFLLIGLIFWIFYLSTDNRQYDRISDLFLIGGYICLMKKDPIYVVAVIIFLVHLIMYL